MILRYALKSTRATIQLAGTLVVGLIAVLLLFSTVNRWRFESNLRDGILAFANGEGDARTRLHDAETLKPEEPLPYIFQGQLFFEQGMRALVEAESKKEKDKEPNYEAAKGYFDKAKAFFEKGQEARKTKAAAGAPSSDTALVGLACSYAALADCAPAAEKPALLEEAAKALTEASQDDGEVTIARAQLALVKGDLAAAQKALDDAKEKLGTAGRNAVGSYYWSRGLLGVVGKKPTAVEDLRRALNFNCTTDGARVLSLAMRVSVADPTAGLSPAELTERCKAMQRLVEMLPKQGKGGRGGAGLDRLAEAQTWNAMGLGYLKALDFEGARNGFDRAKALDTDITYKVNAAVVPLVRANYKPEEARETARDWRRNRLADAARTLAESFRTIPADRPVDPQRACEALMVAAGLYHALGDYADAKSVTQFAREKFSFDEKEYNRTYGAIEDWTTNLTNAVPYYKKAIELNHKESGKMQARIAQFEREKGGRK